MTIPIEPIMIAREWLKKSHEAWHGPMVTWTAQQKDLYHVELGLLVEFVTECWPKEGAT